MNLARFLKSLFVTGSCLFTGIVLLALAISTIATAVFDAQWVRSAAVAVEGAVDRWAGGESSGGADRVRPPPFQPISGDSVAAAIRPALDSGLPERRLERLTDAAGVASVRAQPPEVWSELEPVLLPVIDAIMVEIGPGWRELEDERDLARRSDEVLERLRQRQEAVAADWDRTIGKIPNLQAAELLRALCRNGDGFKIALSSLERHTPSRRAGILRYLIDVDAELTARLWSALSEELAASGEPSGGD